MAAAPQPKHPSQAHYSSVRPHGGVAVPLPGDELLTPIAPKSSKRSSYSAKPLAQQAKFTQARQRMQAYHRRLAWVGTICFAVFVCFGLFQVSRAMLENTMDLAKLARESARVAHAQQQAKHQEGMLKNAMAYYQSAYGREALARDYLRVAGPNDIIVRLESL